MDENDLRSTAEIVLAEKRRLDRAYLNAKRLRESGDDESDEFNAFLESFLLHFRNLVDFLAPRRLGRQQNDVTAGMFLVAAPTEYRSDIDWRLSHISDRRLNVRREDKEWPVGNMLRELQRAWDGFIAGLQATFPERVPWFEEHSADKPGVPPTAIPVDTGVAGSTSEPHGTMYILEQPTTEAPDQEQ